LKTQGTIAQKESAAIRERRSQAEIAVHDNRRPFSDARKRDWRCKKKGENGVKGGNREGGEIREEVNAEGKIVICGHARGKRCGEKGKPEG